MFRTRLWIGLLLVGLLPFAVVMNACSDDGDNSKKAEQSVRDTVSGITDAQKNGNADAFLALVTDRALEKEFFTTRDEVKANPQSIQDDSPVSIESVKVDGDKATADIVTQNAPATAKFVKQNGKWLLDDLAPRSSKGPDGSKSVDVDMKEFAFEFDQKAVTSDKPITFNLKNVGKQDHFMSLVKVPEDLDLQKAFGSPEPPAGIEDIADTALFEPGESASIALQKPLAPGRYVMICFVPDANDPEHTPHALKGMFADFTVE